jgi:ribonuclease P protein component
VKSVFFDVYVCRNTQGWARLGLVVGRRELPRAVDRNRVKRVLRESFRQTQAGLGEVDVVIRLRCRVERRQSRALAAQAGALLKKLGS